MLKRSLMTVLANLLCFFFCTSRVAFCSVSIAYIKSWKPYWTDWAVVCLWYLTRTENTRLVVNKCQLHLWRKKPTSSFSLTSACVWVTVAVVPIVLLCLLIREGFCVWFYTPALLSVEISATCFQLHRLSACFTQRKLYWTTKVFVVIPLYLFHVELSGGKEMNTTCFKHFNYLYKLVIRQDWRQKKTKEIWQYNIVCIDLPAIFCFVKYIIIKNLIYNINIESHLVH